MIIVTERGLISDYTLYALGLRDQSVLTSGSDWREADGMGEFGRIWVDDIRSCLNVVRASLTRDGRTPLDGL